MTGNLGKQGKSELFGMEFSANPAENDLIPLVFVSNFCEFFVFHRGGKAIKLLTVLSYCEAAEFQNIFLREFTCR
jgi:hypothetical protein